MNNSSLCSGCRRRCGLNSIDESARDDGLHVEKNSSFEGLGLMASKIYGLPLVFLLAILLFNEQVLPLGAFGVLFIVFLFLPLIVFWTSRNVGKQVAAKSVKLKIDINFVS